MLGTVRSSSSSTCSREFGARLFDADGRLDHVEVDASLDETLPGVRVRASARAVGRTGVEMEALTAVSVALLTVYDMVKATDRGMQIERVQLLEKTGGVHGDWRRAAGD